MGSPEFVDSGRFSGQKSNFSHTCTLLSQYLKEKGSFGDLSLGISRKFETSGMPTQTMNLLPMIENSGHSSGARPGSFIPNFAKEEAAKRIDSSVEKAQMTIFYGGQVFVFNDFPSEKAEEIMALASKNSALIPPKSAESSAAANVVTSPAVSMAVPVIGNQKPVQPIASDLPIARRHSLARFLEKRKDRITSKAPYGNLMGASSSFKPEEGNKGWLGLGAQISVKTEPQY